MSRRSAGLWRACKGSLLAGPGSGWERQEDLVVQSAAATAAQEGTMLPWLCTLPWKQSWILNRDALLCGCESMSPVLSVSPPAAPDPARSGLPRAQRVGGEPMRRNTVGLGGAGEGSEVGLREKV